LIVNDKTEGRRRVSPVFVFRQTRKITMPIREYEHEKTPCEKGAVFEVIQKADEQPLTVCPQCGGPVRRLVSRPNVVASADNDGLRDKGFTKLVRRGKGLYENVTRREGEDRFFTEESIPREAKKTEPKKPKVWQLDD
jgi:putative FmdB family regulatory protein